VTHFPEQPRTPEDYAPTPSDLKLFARIEGLVDEERALLTIPADRRNGRQTARLRDIGAELDRIWEALRRRAERLAPREATGGLHH
jgi:hypothetical protein